MRNSKTQRLYVELENIRLNHPEQTEHIKLCRKIWLSVSKILKSVKLIVKPADFVMNNRHLASVYWEIKDFYPPNKVLEILERTKVLQEEVKTIPKLAPNQVLWELLYNPHLLDGAEKFVNRYWKAA